MRSGDDHLPWMYNGIILELETDRYRPAEM